MVTNIDTGQDEIGHVEPLLMAMLGLLLLAVIAVGFFMWTSYEGSAVPRSPSDIKVTFKQVSVGKR